MLLAFAGQLYADTATLIPDADATLIEIVPDNSMGGGAYVTAGTTQNGPRNRALMRFDVASAIPPGAKITGAALTVTAIKQSREAPAGANYGLHRLLRSWGEGTNVAETQPGLGTPAAGGDATWNARFFPGLPWTAPGGVEDIDFAGLVTSSVIVDTLGTFALDSTFDLAADVQLWVDRPDLNFGWLFKSEAEETRFTARQFASREYPDPALAPQLVVSFVPGPPLTIARPNSDAVQLSFPAAAGSTYRLEATAALAVSNNWVTMTNFGFITADTMLTARDTSTSSQRFYRVRME